MPLTSLSLFVFHGSLMTQIPKPSTPQLEEQFTALLCNLEQRHALKMLAIEQGVKELVMALQDRRLAQANDACSTRGSTVGQSSNNNAPCPEDAAAIQSFFNRFYTINLGTRLLIGGFNGIRLWCPRDGICSPLSTFSY